MNNPCPSGYRLPTDSEFEAELASWSSSDAIGAFNSPLLLTLTGGRVHNTGLLSSVDEFGCYWSSTVFGIEARYLAFGVVSSSININVRATGHSIRCIKD